MTQIIFIRGAPAVGKTTITTKILLILKKKYHLDCAYICEDDFRKQMQLKYKAKDLEAHLNSVELIKAVIQKLLNLNKYDFIFIEGQFRYKSVLDAYHQFVKSKNFSSRLFQLNVDLEEMKKRDIDLRSTKSKDIEEVKKDIDLYLPKNTILINTYQPMNTTIKQILSYLV